MLSSQLRERIQVFAEHITKNESNENVRTYQHAFYDRADVNFVSSERQMELGAAVIGKVQKFKVRFALGRYAESMVILWRDDYYTITSPEADARKTYLYITGVRAMAGTIEMYVEPEPET